MNIPMTKTTHWPSILILIAVAAGALVFMLAALGLGVSSVVGLFANAPDPAGSMIGAFSTAFEAILLVGVAWFIVQKTSGRSQADQNFQLPFAPWHIAVMLALGALALPIGAAVSFAEVKFLNWLILPLLTLFLIVPPIWVLLGVGTRQLDLGPRWRALGIFGLGMTVGPLIMIVLEFGLLVMFLLFAAFIILREPGMLSELNRLATALQTETDPQAVMQMITPYLFNPSVIKIALAFISLAVPMIEELLKPLGVWLFARQIDKPSQGFALGLLSGAAYALVESLGASGQGDTTWAVVVAVRAGTSLLHIVTTGLMGWAIVAAFRERRWWRLAGTYLTVILIHGIWNAAAVGSVLAAASDMTRDTSWSMSVLPATLCGLAILLVGMVAVLLASNRRAREFSTAAQVPALPNETEQAAPGSSDGVK